MQGEIKKLSNSNNLSTPSLVLASGSPRRHSLLKSLGFLFHIEVADVEESRVAASPAALVLENARLKARKVQDTSPRAESAIVIGADTVVCLNGQVLGKPADANDARRQLIALSGHSHEVVTGLVLLQNGKPEHAEATTTRVRFRDLAPAEISLYLKTAEPYDKAGSYAIQGLASLFVESVEGSYTNVVGFPIESFLRLLQKATAVHPFCWFEKA